MISWFPQLIFESKRCFIIIRPHHTFLDNLIWHFLGSYDTSIKWKKVYHIPLSAYFSYSITCRRRVPHFSCYYEKYVRLIGNLISPLVSKYCSYPLLCNPHLWLESYSTMYSYYAGRYHHSKFCFSCIVYLIFVEFTFVIFFNLYCLLLWRYLICGYQRNINDGYTNWYIFMYICMSLLVMVRVQFWSYPFHLIDLG